MQQSHAIDRVHFPPSIKIPSLATAKPSPTGIAQESDSPSEELSKELPVIIPPSPKVTQTGMASWYGPGFHGRRTANGEVFNQHALTAAHPTLPMGSRAVVTNLNTGQSVEVRINDRGPYKYGRAIDLSYAAARRVGVWEPGVAPVKVEVISPEGLPIEQVQLPITAYAVLVASSTNEEEAIAVMNEVSSRYEDAYLSSLSSGLLRYYQVRFGPFLSRTEAVKRAREASQFGMHALVVTEDDRRVER
jgi:rare lipoprotein A